MPATPADIVTSASMTKGPVPPIEAKDLSKYFIRDKKPIAALDAISLRIAPGQITGLIGPDGAGKTTFMRLCAGLLTPQSGSLRVLGIDVNADPLQVQEQIGYMPQRFGLYEDLTVQENMDLFADLQGVEKEKRPEQYQRLLDMSGMAPFHSRPAGKLSGGMKQKLGLMCTLIRSPRLLLLDEPTVGVDPVSRRELWQIVYQLVEEQKISVLLSTAYLDEAERCAEVALIHQGKVLAHEPPAWFSNKMNGRAWRAHSTSLSNRKLQQLLSVMPGVLDALVLGSSVRVVTSQGSPLNTSDIPGSGEKTVAQVPARFEDYFIATLKEQDGGAAAAKAIELGKNQRGLANRPDEVILADSLVRRFGSFVAVDRVSFRVNSGEIFGLLGANGAGKTTTFRMLCGLLPISSGSCTVAGVNLRSAASAARKKIGYMAQRFSLYGTLTVLHNLRFFSSAYGLKGQKRRQQIQWALDTFELTPFARIESRTIPLGFKQRLALAVALMHSPDVLFLDEPTSGVDPLARREFWTQINRLAEQGVTVLVTTHFMEEAEYCDRIAIMAEGKILAEGSPEEIKQEQGDGKEITMEEAFIHLLQGHDKKEEQA